MTEGGAPALLWGSVQNGPFPPPNRRREAHMGSHKGGSRKSRHRGSFSRFSTLISTLFRACGQVMGTGDERCPEALLAGMDTALADLVALASAILPQEEGPLQPPLLAPAHSQTNHKCFFRVSSRTFVRAFWSRPAVILPASTERESVPWVISSCTRVTSDLRRRTGHGSPGTCNKLSMVAGALYRAASRYFLILRT